MRVSCVHQDNHDLDGVDVKLESAQEICFMKEVVIGGLLGLLTD